MSASMHYTMAPLEDLVGSAHATIPAIWAARAARTPERCFLKHAGRTWTYGQAWEQILRVSGFLLGRYGVGTQQLRTASLLTNCPEAFWIWFGAQTAGAVHAILNVEHRGTLQQQMLEQVRPQVLFAEPELLDLLEFRDGAHKPELIVVAGERKIGHADTFKGTCRVPMQEVFGAEVPVLELPSNPLSAASIMFTSGSTGRSKAVRQPHNMFARGASRAVSAFNLTGADCIHYWFPMFHIGAQLHFGVATVLAGAAISLHERFSMSRFWPQMVADQCTVIGGVTSMFQLVLDNPPPDDLRQQLRLRLAVGGPATAEQSDRFRRDHGISIINTYGLTEAEIVTLPPAGVPVPAGSVGMASPDFELSLVDENNLPVAAGAVGEILIRPLQPGLIMQGYEGMPAETAAAFSDLWFHTGDLARRDADGFLYIVGRRKDVIRRRGENISIAELEGIVTGHPSVKECAAVGIASPLGEEDVKIAVVPRDGADPLDAQALYRWCTENMARFMVPRYIEVRAALPVTGVGKIDRNALKTVALADFDAERNGPVK